MYRSGHEIYLKNINLTFSIIEVMWFNTSIILVFIREVTGLIILVYLYIISFIIIVLWFYLTISPDL